MNVHVGKVCIKAFRGLYSIWQIRKILSEESTKMLIHAFVTSHLDYSKSLLYGIPQCQLDRLQRVLNAAARITCLLPRFADITPLCLMHLHSLLFVYESTSRSPFWSTRLSEASLLCTGLSCCKSRPRVPMRCELTISFFSRSRGQDARHSVSAPLLPRLLGSGTIFLLLPLGVER